MKEKSKKIMAGLGIGLALASGGMLTGCTETPVSDAQVDKVFATLDDANQFMKDTKELIDNQNNELADIKNILAEEDEEQLIEKIIKKYNYAIIKLHLNKDNVWDNLKILWNYDGSDSQRKMEMHYFKLENNTNVFYSKDQENNIIKYADTSVDDEKFNEAAYNACLGTMNGEYHSFAKDEIEQVEILQNGNYLIKAFTNNLYGQENCEGLIEVELTADSRLISISYSTIVKMGENGYGLQNVEVIYEYDVLTKTEVQANIDAYKA